jgi:hypothetical protein
VGAVDPTVFLDEDVDVAHTLEAQREVAKNMAEATALPGLRSHRPLGFARQRSPWGGDVRSRDGCDGVVSFAWIGPGM